MKLPVNYDKLKPKERREVREEYVRLQGIKCFHCGSSLASQPPKEVRDMPVIKELFPPGFFRNPVHLHHCHDSGMTIGAVHSYCNAVLWQYHGE